MLVSKGRRVRLIHSGLTGTITELLDHQMVNVCLDDDGDTIPAFIDDLEPDQPSKPTSTDPAPLGKDKGITIQGSPGPDPKGVLLAFVPLLRPDATPFAYRAYIINDSPYAILLDYRRLLQDSLKKQVAHSMAPFTAEPTDQFPYDALSEGIKVILSGHRILTGGSSPAREKTIRLKPKAFFNKVEHAPILNDAAHLYQGLDAFLEGTTNPLPKPKENLKTYTQERVGNNKQPTKSSYYNIHEVEEYAYFDPEIDLHIEALVSDSAGMPPKEILACQLRHFEQFLAKGYQLGVERVFVIHGLGKGKLRQEIARRLQRMEKVKHFKNEYHPRYGYGATEVIFR